MSCPRAAPPRWQARPPPLHPNKRRRRGSKGAPAGGQRTMTFSSTTGGAVTTTRLGGGDRTTTLSRVSHPVVARTEPARAIDAHNEQIARNVFMIGALCTSNAALGQKKGRRLPWRFSRSFLGTFPGSVLRFASPHPTIVAKVHIRFPAPRRLHGSPSGEQGHDGMFAAESAGMEETVTRRSRCSERLSLPLEREPGD